MNLNRKIFFVRGKSVKRKIMRWNYTSQCVLYIAKGVQPIFIQADFLLYTSTKQIDK